MICTYVCLFGNKEVPRVGGSVFATQDYEEAYCTSLFVTPKKTPLLSSIGTDMFEDSWFQLEGAPWRPLRHPLDAIRHGFNYVQYKLTRSQVSSCFYSCHLLRLYY